MNLFASTNYHELIDQILAAKKQSDPKITFQAMAVATRIPKSYLSKVKSGKAHFSSDQMYLCCKFLGLTPEETQYMYLLLEYARCGVKERRDELLATITARQNAALTTAIYLKSEADGVERKAIDEYFLDPLNPIVHMCLLIPELRKNPEKIAHFMALEGSFVTQILKRFEAMGLIRRERDGSVRLLVEYLHLPKGSPVFHAWRNSMRLLSLSRLNTQKQEQDYSFSATFSGTWEAQKKIQAKILDLIQEIETLSDTPTPESIFQINIDLFSWLRSRNGG